MTAYIIESAANGRYLDQPVIRGYIEFEPVCGTDFCSMCGDCLACYGNDYCPDTGIHGKSIDKDDLDAFLSNRTGYTIHWYPPEKRSGV